MLPFVDKMILVRLRTLCFSDIIEKNIWKERERWNAFCPKGKKVELKIIRTIGISREKHLSKNRGIYLLNRLSTCLKKPMFLDI